MSNKKPSTHGLVDLLRQALQLRGVDQSATDAGLQNADTMAAIRAALAAIDAPDEISYSEQQALAQYKSICDYVAALQCDYDRLQELRDMKDDPDRYILDADECEEMQELSLAAGEYGDADEAREAIRDDALEVQVRSDWQSPGETPEFTEFYILLCTGGPAVRIRGELRNGEPCRAWIEHQDWGTPWTEFRSWEDPAAEHGRACVGVDVDVLLAYCGCFYFGEC